VRIVAVCGSLQRASANAALLRVAQEAAGDSVGWHRFEGLGTLPHFNPDLETEGPPAEVTAWRDLLGQADAVVIATPEYAHSLPGALKDALDWIVGSGELYGTPVALMSAGTGGGPNALEALARTLGAQGARVVASLGVAGVRAKSDAHGEIIDAETVDAVHDLMEVLTRPAF
jgi:NAD(P)H-dependent FMN reductase